MSSDKKSGLNILVYLLFGACVVFVFWIVFYSNFFANLSLIIPLRNWYQKTIWQVQSIGSSEKEILPPENINVVEKLNTGEYVYQFSGSLSSVNWEIGKISLFDKDKNIYTFSLNNEVLSRDDAQKRNVDKSKEVASSSIVVKWKDSRSLQQILTEHGKNPQVPINDPGSLLNFSLFLNLNEQP